MKKKIVAYGQETTVELKLSLYDVVDFMGMPRVNLAIVMDISGGEEDGMPYGVLTTNFGEFVGMRNCAYIDTNNNGEIYQQILTDDIARPTGYTKNSGFCSYPLYCFKREFLQELDPEVFAEYESSYEDAMNM